MSDVERPALTPHEDGDGTSAASEGSASPRSIAAWLRRRSTLTLAVGVQLIAYCLRRLIDGGIWDSAPMFGLIVSGATIFLPGPLQRGNRRQIALSLLLGAIALPTLSWLVPSYSSGLNPLVVELWWPMGVIILVGLVEWLFRPGDSWLVLGRIIGLGLCIGAIYAVVIFLPFQHSAFAPFAGSLTLIALPIVPWPVIDAAYRGVAADRPRRLTLVTAIGCSLIVYAAFFHWGIFAIARRSLVEPGLMERNFAVTLLGLRGRADDYEALAAQLASADWTQPSKRFYDDGSFRPDYRATAVDLLVRRDSSWAAERLADLLVAQPSRPLIDTTNELFVEHQRWETVPITMRYALLESLEVSPFSHVGDDRFKKSLEKLHVPQTIHAWLIAAACSQAVRQMAEKQRQGLPLETSPEAWRLHEPLRSRLADLFKFDAGPRLLDWFEAADEHLAAAPTPLPASVAAETDRIVEAFFKYLDAKQARDDAQDPRARPDGGEIAEPNWDIPTTDAFCREIDDYVLRVNAELRDHQRRDRR